MATVARTLNIGFSIVMISLTDRDYELFVHGAAVVGFAAMVLEYELNNEAECNYAG